jgi:hypothetical protein
MNQLASRSKQSINDWLSQVIEQYAKTIEMDLEQGYKAMAADEEMEVIAKEWCQGFTQDLTYEAW